MAELSEAPRGKTGLSPLSADLTPAPVTQVHFLTALPRILHREMPKISDCIRANVTRMKIPSKLGIVTQICRILILRVEVGGGGP